MIEGSIIAIIPFFHTSNIILSDSSQFAFTGSIPEPMLRNVPASSTVITEYRRQPASGARPLTAAMRQVLEEANKPKKGVSEKKMLDPPNMFKLQRRKSSESLASLERLHQVMKRIHSLIPSPTFTHKSKSSTQLLTLLQLCN